MRDLPGGKALLLLKSAAERGLSQAETSVRPGWGITVARAQGSPFCSYAEENGNHFGDLQLSRRGDQASRYERF